MERDKIEYHNQINWDFLSLAKEFYGKIGYEYLEVPWLAPTDIMHITYDGEYRFKTALGDLVASGEQSFLHVQFNQGLINGRYMTITPCFRDEPQETDWNFRQFIKLELYDTLYPDTENLKSTLKICQGLLSRMVDHEVKIEDMGDGTFDLTSKGIELGSYGLREHRGHKWLYATGLAEPRTSMVKRLGKI